MLVMETMYSGNQHTSTACMMPNNAIGNYWKHRNGSGHVTVSAKIVAKSTPTRVQDEPNPTEMVRPIEDPTNSSINDEVSGWNKYEDNIRANKAQESLPERAKERPEEDSVSSDDRWDIEVEHRFPDPEFYEQMIDVISGKAEVTYSVNWPLTWLRAEAVGPQLPPEHRDQWIPIQPTVRTTWYRLLRDIREFYETGLLAPYSNPNTAIDGARYLRQNHYGYKWVSLYVKKRLDNLTFGQAQVLFENEIPSIFVLQEEFYQEMDNEEISTYYDDWYMKIEALCASCIEADCTKLMTRRLVSACCRDNHKTCDYCEWRAHCFHMFESYRRNSIMSDEDRDQRVLARC